MQRKSSLLRAVIAVQLGLTAAPLWAQSLPNLPAVIERVTERQAERAQNQAVERAIQQAEAVTQRVSERAEAQQVDTVQGQVVDRIESQIERAQGRAAEQTQGTVERVQAQVERAQQQVERAQQQVERAQQQIERAQQQVDRVQSNAAERAGTVLERLPTQAVERMATQASERLTNAEVADAVDVVPQRGPALDTPANDNPPRVNAAVEPDATVAGAATDQATPSTAAPFVEVTIEPGVRAVAFEWVMLVTPDQRAALNEQAVPLLQFLTDTQDYTLTGGELLTFTVPPDLDANDAILDLVPADLRGQIDRNHLYPEQQAGGALAGELPAVLSAVCEAPVRIGLVDSAIDTGHAAFSEAALAPERVVTRSFIEAGREPDVGHGTTVASVLVGAHGSELQPLLPNATLVNAAVFHANDQNGQGATAQRLLAALDWLAQDEELRVINMSLAGPPNKLLAQAIAAVQQRGKVIVAAAGNDGPFGPDRYPAAYEGVLGVTAVDREGQVFRFANQGSEVDFAALGVAVVTAVHGGTFAPASGTSIAAPVVSAFAACALAQQSEWSEAAAALEASALDLGEQGADTVYGKGLLHPGLSPTPASTQLSKR